MPRFLSNGTSLYYGIEGEGYPLVMLHCLPMDRRVWMRQLFHFSPIFRVLTMDFRGLGLSEDSQEEHESIRDLSEDVNNLLVQENIEHAVIFGLSLGGIVTQQFALDHPDKVSALILSGCTHSTNNDVLQARFKGHKEGYSSTEAENYYKNHLINLFSSNFRSSEDGQAILESFLALPKRPNFKSVVKHVQAIMNFNLDDRISEIKAPTFVIAGEKDSALPFSKKIADKIAESKFEIIPGAGHAVNLEKAKEYNYFATLFLLNLSIKGSISVGKECFDVMRTRVKP